MYNKNMSNSFRRLLLIFTLLIAIPFQAIASSVMFGCELTHGLNLVVSAHDHAIQPDPEIHSVTRHDIHTSADGHHQSDPVAANEGEHHASGPDSHTNSGSDSHTNHLTHNSCCSGSASGAVASSDLFLAPAHGSRAESTYISILYLPPVLAGLDRPPQSSLV